MRKYAFDLELLRVAVAFKMKIVDLPIQVHQNVMFSVRHVVRMLVDMAGIAYRLRIFM